jgi:hypothetical protein
MATSTSDTDAVMAEARKTKETAAKLANGDYPENADHVRVLAGMIQKLAEQVETLAGGAGTASTSSPTSSRSPEAKDAEAAVEEDRTPADAPAEPLNDRSV